MNPYHRLLIANKATPGRRFDVRATADEATIYLYEAIVNDDAEAEFWGGVAPEAFTRAIKDITAPVINLRINSPGGSVFAARAIETALREHPAQVRVHIDGLAASAATFIAMAGDEIVMSPGALFMIHNAWSIAFGNASDMRATADLLDKIDGTLVATYAARTKQDPQAIQQWMGAETWFTADEAVENGFADRVAQAEPKAQAAWNLSAYSKAPAPPANAAPPAEDAPSPQSINRAAYLRRIDAKSIPA